jgi:hypothetical protein
MVKNNSVVTHEHPHTKAVRRIAFYKKIDTVSLTTISGMLAGIFLACLMMDPHNDSVLEAVKYLGGGISGGALIGLLLGEIVRREHINLYLKFHDIRQRIASHSGKKRVKEKDIPQGTYWGEHTLGDNSLLKEYDEWLMNSKNK